MKQLVEVGESAGTPSKWQRRKEWATEYEILLKYSVPVALAILSAMVAIALRLL